MVIRDGNELVERLFCCGAFVAERVRSTFNKVGVKVRVIDIEQTVISRLRRRIFILIRIQDKYKQFGGTKSRNQKLVW